MLPLWETETKSRPVPVTGLLVAVNLVVFAYQLWLWQRDPAVLGEWVEQWALTPATLTGGLARGETWWPVLTAMFLHGGLAHVAGNMWFLWVFGRAVEQRLGAARMLVLYLVGGVAASLTQVVFSWGSTVPMLGASGAVAAVLGAYFVLRPKAWVIALVPWIVPILPVPAVVFLLLWFWLQTLQGVGGLLAAETVGVAWWAHVGGFLAGVGLGRVLPPGRGGGRRRRGGLGT